MIRNSTITDNINTFALAEYTGAETRRSNARRSTRCPCGRLKSGQHLPHRSWRVRGLRIGCGKGQLQLLSATKIAEREREEEWSDATSFGGSPLFTPLYLTLIVSIAFSCHVASLPLLPLPYSTLPILCFLFPLRSLVPMVSSFPRSACWSYFPRCFCSL